MTVSGDIKDMELIGKDAASDDPKRFELLRSLRQKPGPVYGSDFLIMTTAADDREGTMHYLPAARAGIMQSYRVIAGSLIARSTTGRADRVAHVPSLSGVVADFMQRIALYSPEDAEDARAPRACVRVGGRDPDRTDRSTCVAGGILGFRIPAAGNGAGHSIDARVVDGLRARSRGSVHEGRHPYRRHPGHRRAGGASPPGRADAHGSDAGAARSRRRSRAGHDPTATGC